MLCEGIHIICVCVCNITCYMDLTSRIYTILFMIHDSGTIFRMDKLSNELFIA